jgi:hypothetical protein
MYLIKFGAGAGAGAEGNICGSAEPKEKFSAPQHWFQRHFTEVLRPHLVSNVCVGKICTGSPVQLNESTALGGVKKMG